MVNIIEVAFSRIFIAVITMTMVKLTFDDDFRVGGVDRAVVVARSTRVVACV